MAINSSKILDGTGEQDVGFQLQQSSVPSSEDPGCTTTTAEL